MSEGVADESAAGLARLVDGLNRFLARVRRGPFVVPMPLPWYSLRHILDVRLSVLYGILFICPPSSLRRWRVLFATFYLVGLYIALLACG